MKTRRHFWLTTILIFYTMNFAQDESSSSPFGQPPEAMGEFISEEQNGVRTFELRLEPANVTQGTLFISLYNPTNPKATFRRSLLAVEPGVYRFEHTLEAGRWRVYMRYGNGIAFRSGYLDVEIKKTPTTLKETAILFYRVLAPDVPDSVQPLGYATFGMILLFAIIAITWILNRVTRNMETVS